MTRTLESLSETDRRKLLEIATRSLTPKAAPAPDVVRRRERSGPVPLSFAQQRLWFVSRTEAGSRAYHVPFGLELRGDLDADALRRALDRIVERHEVLRTTFELESGEARQRVREPAPFRLIEEDLRRLADPRAELRARTVAEASEAFDLARGPVVRGRLLRHDEDAWTLLVTMHHIASDGWSMGLFCRELGALYDAFRRGVADPLPEPPVQYADYALWQREREADGEMKRQAAYWERALAGAPAALELPFDRPRPARQEYAGGAVWFELDAERTARLHELGRRNRATPFMTVLAGWMAVLARWSRQDDVVVGTPVANRDDPRLEPLIGFFVNTLALRVDLTGAPTVAELLARVRACALEAQRHQEVPFERVVERVRPERSTAHSPIFQALFAWQSHDGGALELPGLETRIAEAAPHVVAHFDLTLSLGEKDGRIAGGVSYSTALFDETTARRMAGALRAMLSAMADDEGRRVGDIDLLSPGERHQLLHGWNDTDRELPNLRERGLAEWFERRAARSADATAIRHGETELTYRELDEEANRLAHHLRSVGVAPGSRVALGLARGLEMVLCQLAVLKAGGAYLALDPAHPAERLRAIVDDARPVLVLARTGNGGPWSELGDESRVVDLDRPERPWAGSPSTPLAPTSGGDRVACVIYTSGSTGVPRGVLVEQAAVADLALDTAYLRLGPSDVVAHASNPAFDASTWEIWAALLTGATLVCLDRDDLLSPRRLSASVRREGIGTLFLTTALFNLMASEAPEAFSDLDHVLFGGERVDPARVREVLRGDGPGRLLHCYGPTEATTYATWFEVRAVAEGRTVPIGRPVTNARSYLLDERLRPVPVGVIGEIFIAGGRVTLGYLNRRALTAERFLPDPFADAPGGRMYRTGDLARWLADGTIEFQGRVDFQVKLRGFRIELGEIEARMRELEGVREAVVLSREDEPGEQRLVAYVVAEDEAADVERLSAGLRERLPDFMVPAAYVRLDRLPLTSSGKVDRRALPAPAADAFARAEFEPPRGAVEEALATIWSELLKVERVGRRDNFFDLGGHSLLAMRALSAVQRRLGVKVAITDFFRHPVLESLAAAVERAGGGGEEQEAIPRVAHDGPVPLSHAQQRLWFLAQMEGGSRAYHIPFGVELHGALDVDALGRALDRIVERHEVLRTTFELERGEPRQRVRAPEPFRLLRADVRAAADPRASVRTHAEAEAAEEFDLERGPVVRGRLIRHEDDAYTLLVTMHHIASDGWSMGIFLREIGALYRAFTRGEHDPLPELPIQYADYAAWQQTGAGAGRLARQAEYWDRTLAGAPTMLELPFDRPRPTQQEYEGGVVPIELGGEVAAGLNALVRREGATLFMAVLGGWMALLSRLARQEDVVVGSAVANRAHPQVEGLIGFFVNTLALRVRVEDGLTVRDLLARVKDRSLEGQQHQDMPFEQIVERLQPDRSLAHSPIFQVLFLWQNNEGGALDLPGVEVRAPEAAAHAVAQFDLTVSLRESGDGIVGALNYATSLFDEATARRFAGYLGAMLAAMADDPEREVGAIDLASAAERRQLLDGWNDTRRELPAGTLADLFEERAARVPDRPAVRHGEVELSYRDLDERANRLARHLVARGVAPGQVVAVALPRSAELVIAFLAVLKARAIYLPIDPAYPPERRAFLVADARPARLITRRELWDDLPDGPRAWDWDEEARLWAALSGERPEREPGRGSDAAYVIYTSGSTGIPKGVVVPHRAVFRVVRDNGFARVEEDDRVAYTCNPVFDVGMFEVWAPLLAGARVVVVDQETLLSSEALGDLLDREGVTVLWLTVGLFNQHADALSEVFSKLRYLITGGDVLDPRVIERVLRHGRPRHLVNGYGPTEATIFAATHEIEEAPEGRSIPIGRPVANTRIYILDERRQPVPTGVVGELYIGGAAVALGYMDRDELTAERFLDDPFDRDGGGRMYRSGDLGRWLPDGTIEFRGRNDHQVKVRGYRVELGEIEARLQELPGIRDAVVLARTDQAGGSGDKRLVAYVVAESDELDVEALRARLREVLPEYMVPAAWVKLDRLPVNPNGKVDRRALPAPEADAYGAARFEEPRGETERALAEIWSRLLPVERIGRHDNFFDLGGHSLLTVRLLADIHARFGTELALRDVFLNPVLEDFARRIDTGAASATPDARVLADLALDPAIRRAPGEAPAGEPRSVLLTGATGFFGAFLLRSLLRGTAATVRCLVRAGSAAEGSERIAAAMARYGIGDDFVADRIVAVPGDLAAPGLGLGGDGIDRLERLAGEVDWVVHNGAWVSAAHAYETLRRVNVEGTRELLRLATLGAPKAFHYVSTLSTVRAGARWPEDGPDAASLAYFRALPGGYARSKWVGEMLVGAARARGLAATTYRAPLIGAARRTGASNADDLLSRFIDRCLAIGSLPEMDAAMNTIAVDDLADRFVALALEGPSAPRYNLRNDEDLSIRRLVERLGALAANPLETVSEDEWLRRAGRTAEGDVLTMTLGGAATAPGVADWLAAAREADAGASLELVRSPLDDPYLDRYLAWRMENPAGARP